MSARAIVRRGDFALRTPKKLAEIVRRTKQYLNKIFSGYCLVWSSCEPSLLFYATLQLLNFAQSLRLRWGTPRDRDVALRSDTANVNAAACYIDDDTREHQGCIF